MREESRFTAIRRRLGDATSAAMLLAEAITGITFDKCVRGNGTDEPLCFGVCVVVQNLPLKWAVAASSPLCRWVVLKPPNQVKQPIKFVRERCTCLQKGTRLIATSEKVELIHATLKTAN